MNLGKTSNGARPPTRHVHHSGPGDFKISAYAAIVIAALYLFVITWPVSLAFVLVLMVWFFSRKRISAIARSIHEAALPALIGTGSFWVLSLVVALAPHWSDHSRESLLEAEQWLLEERRYIHALSGPNLTVYLLILAVLLVLLYFLPQSRAIGNLLRAKKQLARVHLCILAFTSFTLFGGHEVDKLARIDHEERVHRFEIGIRSELEPARKFLATQLAAEAVNEALKDPIQKPTKAALIYLIKNVHGPAYREVHVTPEFLRDMSHGEQLAWRVKHLDSWDYEYRREPIEGSSLPRVFIDDLSKEIQEKVPQDTGSSGSNIKSIAHQILGGVAESQEEWHRQEELIDQERAPAEHSEQFYSEASKALTEAITTTFSEALGAVAPHVGELAKEWMKELLSEAIVPSVEHNIESDAESVLKWSRSNLTAGRVQDVPDQVMQKIKSCQAVTSEFLFPAFLTKGTGTSSAMFEGERVSTEISIEIDRRKDIAEKELGGGLRPVEEGSYRKPVSPFDSGRPLTSEEIEKMKGEEERRSRNEERMRERARGPEIP